MLDLLPKKPLTLVDDEAAKECTPCVSPSYQPDKGKTGCLQCDPGKELTGVLGSLTCGGCSNGKFSSTPGSSSFNTF